MLDLDALATRRAHTLQQMPEAWKSAIWSPGFQKLTQSMTDGEVESFVSFCPDTSHFAAIVRFLEQRCESTQAAPFAILKEEASKVGASLPDWFARFMARAK